MDEHENRNMLPHGDRRANSALGPQELARIGYGGIFYANAALQAALMTMKTVLTHIERHGSIAGIENAIMPFDDRQKIVNMERFEELSRHYAIEAPAVVSNSSQAVAAR
jgi:2-methylisocitrate lyase-like PEP mutase family enzyme